MAEAATVVPDTGAANLPQVDLPTFGTPPEQQPAPPQEDRPSRAPLQLTIGPPGAPATKVEGDEVVQAPGTLPSTKQVGDEIVTKTAAPNPSKVTGIGDAATELKKTAELLKGRAQGRTPGVKYDSSLPSLVTTALETADNPTEQRKTLEKFYGKGSVRFDSGGVPYVRTENGWVSTYRSSFLRELGETAVATSPEVAGAIYGGIEGGALGAAGGPLGIAGGAMLGAGAGGLAGRSVKEIGKSLVGTYGKSETEAVRSMMGEFALSAAGEGLVRGAVGIGRAALRAYSPWVPEATKTLVRDALARGLVPGVGQAVPNAKLLRLEQLLSQAIFGNPAEKRNMAVLADEMRAKLQAMGVPADQIDRRMAQIVSRDVPAEALGAELAAKVNSTVDRWTTMAIDLERDIQRSLKDQLDALNAANPLPGSPVAQAVRDAIDTAYRAGADHGRALYQAVDALTKGREGVEMSPVKTVVKEIIDAIPHTAGKDGRPVFAGKPESLQYLRDILDMGEQITYEDAHQIRSELNRMAQSTMESRGIGHHRLGKAADALDEAMNSSAVLAEAPEIMAAFLKADGFWKGYRQQFNDTLANRLVKEAGQGGVEPERVVSTIVRNNLTAQAERIKRIVGPQVWSDIGRQAWQDMVSEATSAVGQGVDPVKMIKLMSGEGSGSVSKEMAHLLWGQGTVTQGLEYARQAAALGGKLDPALVGSGQFRQALTALRETERLRDTFLKENFLAELSKPGFLAKHNTIDWLIKPQNATRVAEAKAFFGEFSPEWKLIRETAMTKILSRGVGATDDPLKTVFTGGHLKAALEETGSPTLKELFGETVAADLYELSKTLQFVTAKGSNSGAGAIAAYTLALHPFSHILPLIDLFVLGKLLSRPGTIEWLALGAREDRVAYDVLREMVRAAEQESAHQLAQDGRDMASRMMMQTRVPVRAAATP